MAIITLYTNEIDNYEELRKDYEENCAANGIEPEEDGEFGYFDLCCEDNYYNLKYLLEKINKKFPFFLAVGSNGGWRGRAQGGAVFESLVDLFSELCSNVDYVTLTYEDGHLCFSGSHHDGSNYYDIYALNKRAIRSIDYDRMYGTRARCIKADRELNEKLDKDYYKAVLTEEDVLY